MSSVSSKSGTSGQDEALRKAREDYRKKEAELIKKHTREIRALNDKYTENIDRKDKQQSALLANARQKTQESLSKRDVKYRKEMDDLRALQSKQLEKLVEENRQKLAAQQTASKQEIKQANLGKSDRVSELDKRYKMLHDQESEKFSNKLSELREDQQKAIAEDREKLSSTHEKEKENIRDQDSQEIAQLKNEYRQLRQNTNQRLKNQEIHHMNDNMRSDKAHMDTLREQAVEHNNIQQISRDGYSEGLKNLRSEMAKVREDDLERRNSLSNKFHNDVEGRIGSQVNRLERDLASEKKAGITERARAEREQDHELRNIRDAYQTKFDYLEKARQDTLRQSNEINSQNVKDIHAEADKQMSTTGRYYLDRMNVENFKNRQALDSMNKDFALRQNYTAENAENRINRIHEDSEDKEVKLRNTYQANVDVMRLSNDEEKKDLRLAVLKDKNTAIQSMKDQVQKQEIEHQRRLTDTISKYEKRISDMNDQFMREKRLRDNREKTLITELKRQNDSQLEALKAQYEDQNKQTALMHDRELKDANRRSQEKLDEVIRAVKKS